MVLQMTTLQYHLYKWLGRCRTIRIGGDNNGIIPQTSLLLSCVLRFSTSAYSHKIKLLFKWQKPALVEIYSNRKCETVPLESHLRHLHAEGILKRKEHTIVS